MKKRSKLQLALIGGAVAIGSAVLAGDIGPAPQAQVQGPIRTRESRTFDRPLEIPQRKDALAIDMSEGLRVSRKGLRQIVSHIPADAIAVNKRTDEKLESCGSWLSSWNLYYRIHTRRIELNRPIDWARMFDAVETDWATRAGFQRHANLSVDGWSYALLDGEYEESYDLHLSDDRKTLTLTAHSPCFNRRRAAR